MNPQDSVFIAGHRGMVGSALVRAFHQRGFTKLLLAPRCDLDLLNFVDVSGFFERYRPDVVVLAAARVGGINANSRFPFEFLLENLVIQNNVLSQCQVHKVRKVVFLGSSCIYPRLCAQPMKEEYLLTGPLEPTNEGYALAKIAGLRLAQYLHKQYGIEVLNPMPCNLYGTQDHFDLEKAHVLSSLVRRFADAVHEQAPSIELWGTGAARREFMHVEDLAEAIFFLNEKYHSPEIINVGWGTDVTIKELALMIADQTGYGGEIRWNTAMPEGMPRKCLDVERLTSLGYKPRINLQTGISLTIQEYRERKGERRVRMIHFPFFTML